MLLEEDVIQGKKMQQRKQECSIKNCTKILQNKKASVKERRRKPG
jgi:hypothetical protein